MFVCKGFLPGNEKKLTDMHNKQVIPQSVIRVD